MMIRKFFVLMLVGCSSSSTNSGTTAPAPSGSSTGGGGGETSSGTPAELGFCTSTPTKQSSTCGWSIDKGYDACTKCLDQYCCEPSKACNKDCACAQCTYEVSTGGNTGCISDVYAEYNAVVQCQEDHCSVVCAKGYGDGSCADVSCGTSADCASQGCGSCSFGKCSN